MEEVLLYVALFVFWVVSQILKARKEARMKAQRPPGMTPEMAEAQRPVAQDDLTFQEALEEIQRALRGEPMPEPERYDEAAEAERLRPRPEPEPLPPTTALRTPPTPTFTSLEAPKPSAAQDFSGTPFVSLEDAVAEIEIPAVVAPVRSARKRSRYGLAARLHSASAAREAFVLSEIFGKPGGLHKPNDQTP